MEIVKIEPPSIRLQEDLVFLKLEKIFSSFQIFKSKSYLQQKLSAFRHEFCVFLARTAQSLFHKIWHCTQIYKLGFKIVIHYTPFLMMLFPIHDTIALQQLITSKVSIFKVFNVCRRIAFEIWAYHTKVHILLSPTNIVGLTLRSFMLVETLPVINLIHSIFYLYFSSAFTVYHSAWPNAAQVACAWLVDSARTTGFCSLNYIVYYYVFA